MPKKPVTPPRERILAHALQEFSERGFSGGRVDRIARRARVNKRMLFYYFGDKESLFHAVLKSVWKQGDILHEAPTDPVASIRFWNDFYTRNEAWVRLLLWEGLELKKPRAPAARQAFWTASVERRRKLAGPGNWPEFLDARHLLLGELGMLLAPTMLPHVACLITGGDARSPEFARDQAAFLEAWVRFLVEQRPPTAPLAK